jgi:Tfp pilus assembly protein PilO
MLLAQASPISGDSTGARVGRWVDGNFPLAVVIVVAIAVVLVVGYLALFRRGMRQRREVRRLRRTYEQTLDRRLDDFAEKVKELRDDVRQLAELQDHVVGQVQMLRDEMTPVLTLAREENDRRAQEARDRQPAPRVATPPVVAPEPEPAAPVDEGARIRAGVA